MRVVVTGATGFIGRSVVPALAGAGLDVVAAGREVTGDIGQRVDWSTILAGARAVVHLAALAHGRGTDERHLRAVNVEGSLALARAAANAGVHLIFMSSVKALGEETPGRPFDEASDPVPQDAYGRAKAEAEVALRHVAGLSLTILRPPLVYGPGVGANYLALLRAVARGIPLPFASIENRRSLIFSGNLASAVLRCVESPAAKGRTFGVSDGPPVSTPALCRTMADALGTQARLFAFPPALLELLPRARRLTRSLAIDDTAIRRDLAWTPPFGPAEGVRRTAEWLRAQSG